MIMVTGANGKLGRLVIQNLLEHVPAAEITALVRTPEKAADLAALGLDVRIADYHQPETLVRALAGVTRVLLISSNDLHERVQQHRHVTDAAQKAGATLLAYTSILRADTSTLALAADHKATESYIRSTGLPFTFLRNGWYLENQTEALAPALAHGAILGAAGEGRFAAAARADYAGAAAAVLLSNGHENKIYELGGNQPYTLSELAAEVSRQAGKAVVYQNLPEAEYAKALAGFGLPAALAAAIADADAGASREELDHAGDDLRKLLGRPITTLEEAVHTALKD